MRAAWALVSVRISMPRRPSALASAADTSSSSSGSTRGSISINVTFDPKEAYIDANSTPTAPAPRIASEVGTEASSRMWSELSTRLPSKGRKGSARTAEPVAISTWRVSIARVPPSLSTTTRRGPSRRPRPCTVSILCLRNNDSMPFAFLRTTFCLC